MEAGRSALTSLPQEVINLITDHLPRQDQWSLLAVSKAARGVAEPALYSAIVLKTRAAYRNFSRNLALQPHLCGLVESYEIGKNLDWWCLDPLDHFPSLRKFTFRPSNIFTQPKEPLRRMMKKIAEGNWMTDKLMHCEISVLFHLETDVPLQTRERLLLTLFSAQSLQTLDLWYEQSWIMSKERWLSLGPTHHGESIALSRPLPALEKANFTNLRELIMRWDGLSLSTLSKLLHAPQQLQILVVEFSLLTAGRFLVADLPLDLALAPVADTLQTLTVKPVDIYTATDSLGGQFQVMEDVGFRWSTQGLTAFKRLDTLGLPASTFTRHCNDTGKKRTLNIPDCVTSLHLADVCLRLREIDDPMIVPEPVQTMELDGPERRGIVAMPEPTNRVPRQSLAALAKAVSDCHRLKLLHVKPSKDLNLDEIKRDPPPVIVKEDEKLIVERGVKIVVELPGGDMITLKTCVEF
ncbi:hypothetical protein NM208_g26 [Fusarium decemcellulare]|uniref:Uncharacterized protein n=1 Tax=Fusarium decemcellulare TaxID=57161 RepID=A0ACC1T0R7_9HYPO|nr:hypothetical protein NM208_g26 [Fusarium decemcellulare]